MRVAYRLVLILLIVLGAASHVDHARAADGEWGDAASPMTIVFVHGILGDSVRTFGESADKGWPALLAADGAIAGGSLRVLSVGYESGPLGRASNVNEIATRLRLKLSDRNIFDRNKKVVFIAHSMGGLVVKRMLVQLAIESPESYSRVAGVFFLATPAGGSDLANLASWLSNNPQFRDMKPQEFNTFLTTIDDDWQSLLRKRSSARPYPRAFCAYETVGTGPGKVIVPRGSSQAGCDETPVAFDLDHSAIVKPKSRNSEVYAYVARRIADMHNDERIELTVSSTLYDTSGNRLPEVPVLYSGGGYVLRVNLSKPGWVYVYSQDSTGNIERYFPSKSTGEQSAAQKSFRIPTDEKNYFKLDNNKGIERLYIFASSTFDNKLGRLHDEVANSERAALPKLLEREVVKRGATVSTAAPLKGAPAGVAMFKAGSIGSEAATILLIEHR